MQRPVVEVEDEMAVRIPEEVGAKAVADKAKTANAATMRGVREIMVGVSRIRSHRPRSILCARVVEDTMCRMTHDEDRSATCNNSAIETSPLGLSVVGYAAGHDEIAG